MATKKVAAAKAPAKKAAAKAPAKKTCCKKAAAAEKVCCKTKAPAKKAAPAKAEAKRYLDVLNSKDQDFTYKCNK